MAAFGAGGYENTPLGAALPVVARQQDRQIRPSVALAIVIDSSGSMQGDRLDLAKQVARQTVRKLDGNDWVGVVEFYGARQWSVPMHHATDIPDVERSIGRMQAQGASVLFPALQEAFYGLKDLDARYKHILVISDGGVAEDRYQQLIRHIADNRINVSTVAVGGQVDDERAWPNGRGSGAAASIRCLTNSTWSTSTSSSRRPSPNQAIAAALSPCAPRRARESGATFPPRACRRCRDTCRPAPGPRRRRCCAPMVAIRSCPAGRWGRGVSPR